MADEEVLDKKAAKKAEKEAKKAAKKAAKEGGDGATSEEDEEKLGIVGKFLMFLLAVVIVAIWLAIFALLIKMDVGGFGTTLFPVLKDVPYVNMILPGIEEYQGLNEVDENYPYKTVESAIERIKELEIELQSRGATDEETSAYIAELEAAAEELAKYKTNEANFEKEKEKFYEEVVFGSHSPDIEEYKSYYESISPENAEEIYKQVVTQLNEDKELQNYVDTYSTMKAKNAATIFDAMEDDFDLVAKILQAMEVETRANILAAMTSEHAAVLTEMMEP